MVSIYDTFSCVANTGIESLELLTEIEIFIILS